MKNIKFLVEKPIAHRGLHDKEIAENSLLAFSRAMDGGHPIELDVQITVDGKLIVLHDWTLDRMTGNNGKVSEMKYEDIKNLTLGNSSQKILLFEDILNLVNGEVALIVEIKSKLHFDFEVCEKVFEVLKNYNGQYAISSFNPFVVKWFTKNAQDVVRGQNFTNFGNQNCIVAFCKKIFMYTSWIISNNKPDFFACRANSVPNSWPVKIAKKRKKLLLVWKIENMEEYGRIEDVIDNEFFDGVSYIK